MRSEQKNRLALLVSDEEEFITRMRSALESAGFETVVAIDAIHARRILRKQRPNFVCTDLILPRGSGHDVCRLIRGNPVTRNIPILVMDDRGLPEETAFAEEAGASALLKKPFSMNEFRSQVEAAIERAPLSSKRALKVLGSALASEAPS